MLLVFCLIVALVSWIDAGWACLLPKEWGKPIKREALLSPDRRTLAWAETISKLDPATDLGKLFVRDEKTAQVDTVFAARATSAGKIIWHDGKVRQENVHVFCDIDWSWDSRYLIIDELISHTNSDVFENYYWIYDRAQKSRSKIDTKYLNRLVTENLRSRGLLTQASWGLIVTGWERAKSYRVVFASYPYHSPDQTLPTTLWTTAPTGSEPKLLSDKKDSFEQKLFGHVVPAP